MSIQSDLFYRELGRRIWDAMKAVEVPEFLPPMVDEAIEILERIQKVICTEGLSDFERVDEIVQILIAYDMDVGGCHDF